MEPTPASLPQPVASTPYAGIAAILIGYAVLISGNGLLGTLVSLQLASPAFSPGAVGIVQSAYYLGFMLGALGAGNLIGRIGHHHAFSVFAVVVACSSLAHAFVSALPAWFVLRLVTGACLAGIFSVLESQLNAVASNQFRGRVFAFYMMTTYLGVASGQLMLNLASPTGSELFSLIAVLFSASLLPILLTGRQDVPVDGGSSRNRFDLGSVVKTFRVTPLGMCGCVVAGLLNSSFYALMPVFLKNTGFSTEEISGALFSALLTALVFQWPIGLWSDKVDRRKVLFFVCLLIGVISLIVVSNQGKSGLVGLICLYAAMSFTVYALSVALVNDRIPPDSRISASVGVLLMFSLGGCAGPVLASRALTSMGPYGIFWFSIAVTGGLAALILCALCSDN
jgi:MFS family permease